MGTKGALAMHARVLVLVGLVGLVAGGGEKIPDTAAAYRERYMLLQKRLQVKRAKRIGWLIEVYREHLQKLLPLLMTDKDGVEYTKAIQGELERLRTDPTPPKTPGDAYLGRLAAANLWCRQRERELTAMYRKETAELTEVYMRGLEGLTVRLEAAHDTAEVEQVQAGLERARALMVKLKAPMAKVEKAVLKARFVTVVVEAVIDGNVELVLSEKGLRWVCAQGARVGIGGTKEKRIEVPVKVDGKDWRPVFRKLKRGGRRSDIYPMEGLGGGTVLTTVLALREGGKARRSVESRVPILYKGGPIRHVITIQHERRRTGAN